MIDAALETAAGADGLFFMPFLSGERSPFWNDTLSGGFYGLRLSHTRYHMIRAVMEGVAFSLRYLLDIYHQLGVKLEEIAFAGGGVNTPGWAQIFANISNLPLVIYSGQETVTHGLYAYVCLALGIDKNFEQALERTFQEPEYIEPSASLVITYDPIYTDYCQLTDAAYRIAQKT